jgi:DNA-binding transcriptional LysR family regulator
MAIASVQYDLSPVDLAVVLALARRGTLASAGEVLAVDSSTVFRALQRIEKGVQQRLFERTRGGYSRDRARHAARAACRTHRNRTRIGAQPGERAGTRGVGTVRISTTDTLAHGLLLPALKDPRAGASAAGVRDQCEP